MAWLTGSLLDGGEPCALVLSLVQGPAGMGSLALKPLQLSGLFPSMISLDPHANPGMQNLLLPFTMRDGSLKPVSVL